MKKSFDVMKWWPLLSFLLTLTCAGAVAYYRLGKTEDRQAKQGEWCQRLSGETSSLRERCAKLEGVR